MKMKKIVALGLSAVMAAGALTACSGGGESSTASGEGGNGKILIWAWDETFNIKAAEDAKAMYLKDNPDADIEIVTMSQDDIVQKLHTSLSSGQTSGLPSIVLIEDYKAQTFLTGYPDSFEDLTDIVAEDDFNDYKFAVNKVDDKIYSVPFDSGVAGLFYRTDYLQQAGHSVDEMKDLTWEKYIEIGKDVLSKTGHPMLTLDPSDMGQLRIMMQSAGEWYVKDDGKTVNLKDNGSLKAGMEIWKQMFDTGIAKQVGDWDSFVTAFQNGEVASVPTGCWISSSIQKAADQSGKWAIAPIPRLGSYSKSKNASSIGGGGWYVLKGAGDTQASKDFLKKTFASSTELVNQLADEIGLVSNMNAAADTDNYAKGYDFYGGQKVFEDFAGWSADIPVVNYGQDTYAIEDVVSEAVQSYVNGTSIDEALSTAQSQAEGVITAE